MEYKLVSWNVNGIRASMKKGFETSLLEMNPDMLCLQETKAQDDQVQEALEPIKDYKIFSNSAVKKGYSGTAILSKTEPAAVKVDIGIEEHDQEGRVLTAEYEHFYLVTVYVPNSSRGLTRLEYREGWDQAFLKFLKGLEKDKPVVVCGDFNVAHQPIDLARPKSNYNKTAGYTQQEIDGMSNYVNAGFIDTFRFLYPEKIAYSWWSYMFNSRAKNIGWRIDYFLTSASLQSNIVEATILPDYMESDHCPISLTLKF